MNNALLQEISLSDRTGTDSEKWDNLQQIFGRNDLLPLWVADMDFKVPLCVRQALHRTVDSGAFGYTAVPERYYTAIQQWELRRHNNPLRREWLRTTSGVVTGLYHLVQAITQPGDGILLQTPVYYPFFDVVRHTGRTLVCNPLREQAGHYTIDLVDFEKKIVDCRVKCFLLCSPHNPVGRVWTRGELEGMIACCRRHQVQIVADEIHHDIIMPGYTQIPMASLCSDTPPITFFSASKTFNLAGMKNSVLAIPDETLRRRFDAFEQTLGTTSGSTLDYVAVTAAYEGGEAWLDAVLEEIYGNAVLVRQALSAFPQVTLSPLEGTYLQWVDLSQMVSGRRLRELVQDRCRIAPDYGTWFTPDRNREDVHIRLNLAAPHETISRAARQMSYALQAWGDVK